MPEHPLDTMGKIIRALRMRQGMSVTQFAGRLGVSQAIVSMWEHDQVDIPTSRVEKIAEELGVHPGDLYPCGNHPAPSEESHVLRAHAAAIQEHNAAILELLERTEAITLTEEPKSA